MIFHEIEILRACARMCARGKRKGALPEFWVETFNRNSFSIYLIKVWTVLYLLLYLQKFKWMSSNLKSNLQDTSVSVLMINDKGMMISVLGQDYFLSYNRIPWMRDASISEALNVRMSGRNAIEWPALDVDLEIESLKHPERYPLVMKR